MRPEGKWPLWYYVAGTQATFKWYSKPYPTPSCQSSLNLHLRHIGYKPTCIINIIHRLRWWCPMEVDSSLILPQCRLGKWDYVGDTVWYIAHRTGNASREINVWIQLHLLKGRTILAFSEICDYGICDSLCRVKVMACDKQSSCNKGLWISLTVGRGPGTGVLKRWVHFLVAGPQLI